MIILKGFISVK